MHNDVGRAVHGTLFGEAVLSAEVPALLADEGGQYVGANDAACALTGYTRAELTALRLGELSATNASQRIYSHIASGRKLRGRKDVRRKDGQVLRCRYWAIACRAAGLPYFLLLLWPAPGGG